MDKKTRTLNALTGKPVDRPPMTFWCNFVGEKSMGQPCVQAHVDYYRDSGADFVKMTADGYMNIPDVGHSDVSDWAHLKLPKMTDFYITDQLDRIKRVRDAIQDETCVFYNMFNPFTMLLFSTSDDFMMESLRSDDPRFWAAYDNVADWAAEFATLMITDAGCKGVFHPVMNCEKSRFTPEEYNRWIRPRDLKVIEATNKVSDTNIIHLCGGSGKPSNMECWRDYPGAVINWDVHVDPLTLREGKTYFTKHNTVMGGFSNKPDSILYNGTREEIQKFTVDLVRETGKDNFIVSADCSLRNDMDPRRLHWIAEALDSTL